MKEEDIENGRMLAADYFAGIALGYFLKKYKYKKDLAPAGYHGQSDFFSEICSSSYAVAFEMLEARDKASKLLCDSD
jgi:hypothetical protein